MFRAEIRERGRVEEHIEEELKVGWVEAVTLGADNGNQTVRGEEHAIEEARGTVLEEGGMEEFPSSGSEKEGL